ncbi:hypothetical protein [Mesobacillus subterraneus]|uniref:Uncharacterized protein n=1 Tax=Mesobacillus subterraneus TaxID=285983 RepID=A0A3R9EZS5_9BACI|nr:hypothetical protein [Mesobacillus subterraneus]RSD26872.1 hypothetical protein EJA10_13570 [Mesobacillus subterraneus]
MKNEDRLLAEKVLRQLFIGAKVDGLQLGTNRIFFKRLDHADGQLYLNIESKWCLFPSPPEAYPKSEDEIESYSEREALRKIDDIRGQEAVNIELGADSPHLIITFTNGTTLFINGRDHEYECSQAGVHPNDDWLIVALPGDDIAVWTP